jgi:hypothetical protein
MAALAAAALAAHKEPTEPAPCPDGKPQGSFVYQPAYSLDALPRPPAAPYAPQAGDIIFFTDYKIIWKVLFGMAFTGHPYHSSIVVKMPDGSFATFEAGPHDTICVKTCSLPERLQTHDGTVWVRRRRVPLTEEQSARLTDFALRQDQKRYALGRLALQLTPFRARGPLKTRWLGKAQGEHGSYFCSEAVLEAAVYAGILDPETTRPGATYPRDFFFDESVNPYINKTLKLWPCWDPPQLWTGCPACDCR